MVSFVRVGEVCGREEEDICSKGPGIAWLVHNVSSAFYSSRVTNYIHTNTHTHTQPNAASFDHTQLF